MGVDAVRCLNTLVFRLGEIGLTSGSRWLLARMCIKMMKIMLYNDSK